MKYQLYLINLICIFFALSAQAFDIRSINNNKIISKAAYDINDTNLVDIENAENLLKYNKNTKDAFIEKQEEIIKNNKNRSQPKYKGGAEELYDHRSDPDEFHNLADDPRYKSIKDKLRRWLPRSEEPEFKKISERKKKLKK